MSEINRINKKKTVLYSYILDSILSHETISDYINSVQYFNNDYIKELLVKSDKIVEMLNMTFHFNSNKYEVSVDDELDRKFESRPYANLYVNDVFIKRYTQHNVEELIKQIELYVGLFATKFEDIDVVINTSKIKELSHIFVSTYDDVIYIENKSTDVEYKISILLDKLNNDANDNTVVYYYCISQLGSDKILHKTMSLDEILPYFYDNNLLKNLGETETLTESDNQDIY